MKVLRKIELLAPARNLECGIEAVNHGADAVYIGAPKFGARAAATNSMDDIGRLTDYAHLYRLCPPLRSAHLCDGEHHPEGRGAEGDGGHDLGTVSQGCGCTHRAGHGPDTPEPATHPAACQHADGQPNGRKGALSGGGRLPTGGTGARIVARRDSRHPQGLSRHAARGVCARGFVCKL